MEIEVNLDTFKEKVKKKKNKNGSPVNKDEIQLDVRLRMYL